MLYYYFSITFVLDSVGRFSSRKGEQVRLFFFLGSSYLYFYLFHFFETFIPFSGKILFFLSSPQKSQFRLACFFFSFLNFKQKQRISLLLLLLRKFWWVILIWWILWWVAFDFIWDLLYFLQISYWSVNINYIYLLFFFFSIDGNVDFNDKVAVKGCVLVIEEF